MTKGRTFILSALSATALTGFSGGATAQSACGSSTTLNYGETLYSVAQECRVSLARIMDLNPSLGNVRDIEAGTRIDLEARSAGDTGGGDTTGGSGEYRVREGDTAYSIAQAMGISLYELLSQNPELDPWTMAVGEILDIPQADERQATVSVTPQSGPSGSEVTVSARNLRPDDWVTVGVGRVASEWSARDEVQVAADGELRTDVTVPQWADADDRLIFVVDTDRGMTFKSGDFNVTRADAGGGDDGGDRIALEGEVNRGVECHTLTTRDGDTWSLVSDNVDFTSGEYVEVEGTRADMSICQQGVGTVDVAQIEEVARPGGGNDGGGKDVTSLEGRIRQGVECYTLTTPDGDTWSVVSDGIPFTEGEYVEVEGQTAEMSFCQQGVGTFQVEELEEVRAPGNLPDDTAALDRAAVRGAWTAKGGSCDRPDFDVTARQSGQLSVETSLNGSPRTGEVRLSGEDNAFVFDQPYRALQIENRGEGELAVIAPSAAQYRFGGHDITGDGVVFVRC